MIKEGKTITITGTVQQVNAAIDGVVYTPDEGFIGEDDLSVFVERTPFTTNLLQGKDCSDGRMDSWAVKSVSYHTGDEFENAAPIAIQPTRRDKTVSEAIATIVVGPREKPERIPLRIPGGKRAKLTQTIKPSGYGISAITDEFDPPIIDIDYGVKYGDRVPFRSVDFSVTRMTSSPLVFFKTELAFYSVIVTQSDGGISREQGEAYPSGVVILPGVEEKTDEDGNPYWSLASFFGSPNTSSDDWQIVDAGRGNKAGDTLLVKFSPSPTFTEQPVVKVKTVSPLGEILSVEVINKGKFWVTSQDSESILLPMVAGLAPRKKRVTEGSYITFKTVKRDTDTLLNAVVKKFFYEGGQPYWSIDFVAVLQEGCGNVVGDVLQIMFPPHTTFDSDLPRPCVVVKEVTKHGGVAEVEVLSPGRFWIESHKVNGFDIVDPGVFVNVKDESLPPEPGSVAVGIRLANLEFADDGGGSNLVPVLKTGVYGPSDAPTVGLVGEKYWEIDSVRIDGPGSGYAENELLTLSGQSGPFVVDVFPEIRVSEVSESGKILEVTVIEKGKFRVSPMPNSLSVPDPTRNSGIWMDFLSVAQFSPCDWGISEVTIDQDGGGEGYSHLSRVSAVPFGWLRQDSSTVFPDSDKGEFSAFVKTVLEEPEVFVEPCGVGKAARLRTTVSKNKDDDGNEFWQVEEVVVDYGGWDYQVGDVVQWVPFGVSTYPDHEFEALVSEVDNKGKVISVAVLKSGKFFNDTGVIESITVENSGRYFVNKGVPASVLMNRLGRYYREDSSVDPYVSPVRTVLHTAAGRRSSPSSPVVDIADRLQYPQFLLDPPPPRFGFDHGGTWVAADSVAPKEGEEDYAGKLYPLGVWPAVSDGDCWRPDFPDGISEQTIAIFQPKLPDGAVLELHRLTQYGAPDFVHHEGLKAYNGDSYVKDEREYDCNAKIVLRHVGYSTLGKPSDVVKLPPPDPNKFLYVYEFGVVERGSYPMNSLAIKPTIDLKASLGQVASVAISNNTERYRVPSLAETNKDTCLDGVSGKTFVLHAVPGPTSPVGVSIQSNFTEPVGIKLIGETKREAPSVTFALYHTAPLVERGGLAVRADHFELLDNLNPVDPLPSIKCAAVSAETQQQSDATIGDYWTLKKVELEKGLGPDSDLLPLPLTVECPSVIIEAPVVKWENGYPVIATVTDQETGETTEQYGKFYKFNPPTGEPSGAEAFAQCDTVLGLAKLGTKEPSGATLRPYNYSYGSGASFDVKFAEKKDSVGISYWTIESVTVAGGSCYSMATRKKPTVYAIADGGIGGKFAVEIERRDVEECEYGSYWTVTQINVDSSPCGATNNMPIRVLSQDAYFESPVIARYVKGAPNTIQVIDGGKFFVPGTPEVLEIVWSSPVSEVSLAKLELISDIATGEPQEVRVLDGGAYYVADESIEPYIAKTWVSVDQSRESNGKGLEFSLTADVDPQSKTFGALKTIDLVDGGSGYNLIGSGNCTYRGGCSEFCGDDPNTISGDDLNEWLEVKSGHVLGQGISLSFQDGVAEVTIGSTALGYYIRRFRTPPGSVTDCSNLPPLTATAIDGFGGEVTISTGGVLVNPPQKCCTPDPADSYIDVPVNVAKLQFKDGQCGGGSCGLGTKYAPEGEENKLFLCSEKSSPADGCACYEYASEFIEEKQLAYTGKCFPYSPVLLFACEKTGSPCESDDECKWYQYLDEDSPGSHPGQTADPAAPTRPESPQSEGTGKYCKCVENICDCMGICCDDGVASVMSQSGCYKKSRCAIFYHIAYDDHSNELKLPPVDSPFKFECPDITNPLP